MPAQREREAAGLGLKDGNIQETSEGSRARQRKDEESEWSCQSVLGWACALGRGPGDVGRTQARGLRSSVIPTWLTLRPEPSSLFYVYETLERVSTQSEEGLSSPVEHEGFFPLGKGAKSQKC